MNITTRMRLPARCSCLGPLFRYCQWGSCLESHVLTLVQESVWVATKSVRRSLYINVLCIYIYIYTQSTYCLYMYPNPNA